MKASLARNRRLLRPGTAMTEFALALPLLLLVLAAMLFVGSAMQRKQNVVVASRYNVWRIFDGGEPSPDELNRGLLGRQASSVHQATRVGPNDAMDHWIAQAYRAGTGAGRLAEEWFLDSWPGGGQSVVSADFPNSVRFAQRASEDISFRHGRDGVEWVHGQVAPWGTLQDEYYQDLDDALRGATDDTSGQGLAQRIVVLYSARW